jgi:Family of unknown function (DUF6130)
MTVLRAIALYDESDETSIRCHMNRSFTFNHLEMVLDLLFSEYHEGWIAKSKMTGRSGSITSRINKRRSWPVRAAVIIACLAAASAAAQTAREVRGAAAFVPLQNQPPAKIVIDSPLSEPLSPGVVFIRYRTENLDIVQVFGSAALALSPRVGHIHVTVDEALWHWADASVNPVILQGLAPGPHKILIELADANHTIIDQGTVDVTIPVRNSQPEAQ